jgi:hypothetical protein
MLYASAPLLHPLPIDQEGLAESILMPRRGSRGVGLVTLRRSFPHMMITSDVRYLTR